MSTLEAKVDIINKKLDKLLMGNSLELTVNEAAIYMDLAPGTVRNKISSGELQSFKKGNKRMLLKSDIDVYLQGV